MEQISFSQLLIHHALDIPLPQDNTYICRECGGKIGQDEKVLTRKEKYSDSWVDEGVICHSQGEYVCQSCKLTCEDRKRILITPPDGCVIYASAENVFPNKDILQKVFTGKIKKRDKVFPPALSLFEFLTTTFQTIKPPYGLVLSYRGGAGNKKHFIRIVPLNYSISNTIKTILIPTFEFVSFRRDAIIEAHQQLLPDVLNLKGKPFYEKLKAAADGIKLSIDEKKVLLCSINYLSKGEDSNG